MRRFIAVLALAALVAPVASQNPLRESYGFGTSTANDATVTLHHSELSGAPILEFQFTTSDTVEYTMSGATFDISTNTITANDTVLTFPSASSAAANLGEHTVSWAQGGTAADALDTQFFIADRAYTVTEINVVWGGAESTGSMDVMVERLQGTEACAAGDDLQAAAVDATATANTVTTPALTGTPANLDLAAGNRLCVDVSATPDEVTNLVVTVTLVVN